MIYTWSGNYVPYGLRSWVDYPCCELKSNVTDLSNYLEMYLNYGKYNGIQVLDSTTVNLMTTVYDTMTNGQPLGLIWMDLIIPYFSWWPQDNIWFHFGACGSIVFFNKQNSWGGVITGNDSDVQLEIIRPVIEYASTFTEFAVSSIKTFDNSSNGII